MCADRDPRGIRPSAATDQRPRLTDWDLDRRTFLKVAGLSGAALLSAHDVLASRDPRVQPATRAPATTETDPIARLADSLDFDVERMFRFVSDEIRYEPYAGVLRGPLGTLWARAGNAADQALLLGALLDASGVSFRFAVGALDDATAGALMGSAITNLAGARGDATAAWQQVVPGAVASVAPSVAPEIQQRLDEARAAAPGVVAWASQQIDDGVATISSELAAAGVVLSDRYSALPDLERRQHVWVQASAGPAWQDLDASLPGATSGQALATATSTPDSLADELRHHIQFAILDETASGDSLSQAITLTVDAFADELVGTPIQFLNVRPEGLKGLGVGIADAIAGKTSYLPALLVGEAAHVGGTAFGFTTGGGVPDPSLAPSLGDGDATAQWLEITIAAPDRAPVVVRRTIFDRIGVAARATGNPDLSTVPPAALTDLGPDLHGEYFPALAEHWFTVSSGRLAGEGLRAAILPAEDTRAFVDLVHAYHLVREAADLELALPGSVRTFHDAPNVVACTVSPRLDPGGAPQAEFAIDVLHRSFGTLPVSGQPVAAMPGVVAGVLSHVAERILFGEGGPSNGVHPARQLASVGAVFEAAKREGVALRVLRAGAMPTDLDYPPEALATLNRSLSDGWIAIAPQRPVSVAGQLRSGWWLVDLATGGVADQMDDGRGMAAGEYAATLGLIAVDAAVVARHDMWMCIIGWVVLVAAALVGIGAAKETLTGSGATGAGLGMFGLSACLD